MKPAVLPQKRHQMVGDRQASGIHLASIPYLCRRRPRLPRLWCGIQFSFQNPGFPHLHRWHKTHSQIGFCCSWLARSDCFQFYLQLIFAVSLEVEEKQTGEWNSGEGIFSFPTPQMQLAASLPPLSSNRTCHIFLQLLNNPFQIRQDWQYHFFF